MLVLASNAEQVFYLGTRGTLLKSEALAILLHTNATLNAVLLCIELHVTAIHGINETLRNVKISTVQKISKPSANHVYVIKVTRARK